MSKQQNDIVYTKTPYVSCDGGNGIEGHPKIYLEIIPAEGEAVCPYCSKKFILKNK